MGGKATCTNFPPLWMLTQTSRNQLLVATQVVLEADIPCRKEILLAIKIFLVIKNLYWQREWKSSDKCDVTKEELTGFGK